MHLEPEKQSSPNAFKTKKLYKVLETGMTLEQGWV